MVAGRATAGDASRRKFRMSGFAPVRSTLRLAATGPDLPASWRSSGLRKALPRDSILSTFIGRDGPARVSAANENGRLPGTSDCRQITGRCVARQPTLTKQREQLGRLTLRRTAASHPEGLARADAPGHPAASRQAS